MTFFFSLYDEKYEFYVSHYDLYMLKTKQEMKVFSVMLVLLTDFNIYSYMITSHIIIKKRAENYENDGDIWKI